MANTKLTFDKGLIFYGDLNSKIFHPDSRFDNYDVSKMGFNQELYDYYINRRNFQDAYTYASMFHYQNVNDEKKHRAEALLLKDKAVRKQAVDKNILSDEQAHGLAFSYSVFNQSEYNCLDSNNIYKQRFEEYKKRLGSENGAEATNLHITFGREKQTFLGIDWLAHDNPNTFDNFKKEFGYNDEYFNNHGIKINRHDGTVTLEFNKNNSEANQILYNLASSNYAEARGALDVFIQGYDDKGNKTNSPTTIVGSPFSTQGGSELLELITDPYNAYKEAVTHGAATQQIANLKNLRDIINDANKEKLKAEAPGGKKVYNSRIYGFADERIGQLQAQLDNLDLSSTEASNIIRDIKAINGDIINKLMGSGLQNYDVRTNYFNNEGDLTLWNIKSNQVGKLRDILTNGLRDPHTTIQDMESGGKFGTLVTIPASIKETARGTRSTKTIDIFIPGFRGEEVQNKIVSDPIYAATHELDMIEAYGGTYTLSDGREVGAEKLRDENNNPVTQYYIRGTDPNEPLEYHSAEEISPLITAEKAVEQTYDAAFIQYTNKDGKITNRTALNKDLAASAIYLANTIFGAYGIENIKYEELFDQNGNMINPAKLEQLIQEMNTLKYEKFKNAQDIFYKLISKFNWME